jgi:CYTH domain-containing protein
MGMEIERKFLLKNDDWKKGAEGVTYRQGYLSTVKERTVRVRTIAEKGFLTIKGMTTGMTRSEFEYDIPLEDADYMLDALCEKPLIEKKRFKIALKGLTWEIDEFFGENEGLVLAEVELESEDQDIEIPSWIGKEVTGDPRYFNANLVRHPYSTWS